VSPAGPITASGRGLKARPVFFGWYIVGAGFLFLSIGYGARYSFSVFFPSLLAQFNWPRDLTASILSTHLLLYGATAPLTGFLVDRIGARRTMLTGAILLALGLFLSPLASAPWHFYLTFGALAGVGLCLLASVPLTVIIRNWFERRRGTAISLLFLGEGMAYAWYPVVVWLIDRLSWRKALAVEGGLVAVVFLPLILFVMTTRPADRGLTRDGGPERAEKAAATPREEDRIVDRVWAAVDWTLPRALRTGRFFLCCLASFCIWGLSHHILVTHQIAFAMDVGFPRLYSSAVLSLGGPAFGLGCILSLVSDRIGREWTITWGTVLQASGILVLLLVADTRHPWMLYYFALSFGVGFGMCVPMVAVVVTDIFQGPRAGTTIGLVWFAFALGAALGPWLGGRLFELFGDYLAAFIVAGLTSVLGCLAVWWAAPRKVRLVPGKVAKVNPR